MKGGWGIFNQHLKLLCRSDSNHFGKHDYNNAMHGGFHLTGINHHFKRV